MILTNIREEVEESFEDDHSFEARIKWNTPSAIQRKCVFLAIRKFNIHEHILKSALDLILFENIFTVTDGIKFLLYNRTDPNEFL